VGWPKWCEDNYNESACVLIIASEGWFAAYEKTASPGLGLGAATEADLFRQTLWDEQGNNTRIRLVFLHNLPIEQVPRRLRVWHQFRPFDNDDQLNQLIRWVAGHLSIGNINLPTVRWPEPIDFRPKLADRLREWPAIAELLAGRSRERILLFEGPSGLGKSALVRQAATYAKGLNVPVVQLDLRGGELDVEGILGQFYLDLGQSLPDFSREGGSKTILLRKDLRRLRQPVLAIFDTYEGCVGNQTVVDWINQQFLIEVETALGLAVIVAGQRIPDYNGGRWQNQARHFALKPITDVEQWVPWVEAHYPGFRGTGVDLPTLVMIARGNPAVIVQSLDHLPSPDTVGSDTTTLTVGQGNSAVFVARHPDQLDFVARHPDQLDVVAPHPDQLDFVAPHPDQLDFVAPHPDQLPPPDTTPASVSPNVKPKPAALFICYSSKDTRWREGLRPSLNRLQRKGIIDFWYDRMVSAGTDWNNEIQQKLDESEIVLCLVSRDFLDAPYIEENELPKALDRHRAGKARLIPLIVRPCNWEDTPLSELQTATGDTRPLANWRNKDAAYMIIEKQLEKVWREFREPSKVKGQSN
jgi:hypothetical protein